MKQITSFHEIIRRKKITLIMISSKVNLKNGVKNGKER